MSERPGVVVCPGCWRDTDEMAMCGCETPECPTCHSIDHDKEGMWTP